MATIPSRVLLGTFVVYILCISSLFSLVNATSSELYETIVNPRIKISSKSSPSLLWGSVHYPWTRAGNVCRPKGATFTNFRREEKFGDDNLHTSINRRDRLPRAFRLCLSIAVVNEVSNRSAAEHLEILSRVEDTCVELKTTAQEDVPKEESKKSLPSKILPERTQCPRPTFRPVPTKEQPVDKRLLSEDLAPGKHLRTTQARVFTTLSRNPRRFLLIKLP